MKNSSHYFNRRRMLIFFLVITQLLTYSTTTFAQTTEDIEEAKREYEKGSQYFTQGNFHQAREAFLKSYELSKNKLLFFNVAKSYQSESDYPNAIKYYKLYLDGVENAYNKEDVLKLIDTLNQKIDHTKFDILVDSVNFNTYLVYLNNAQTPTCKTPCTLSLTRGKYNIRGVDEDDNEVKVQFEVQYNGPNRPIYFEGDKGLQKYGYLQLNVDKKDAIEDVIVDDTKKVFADRNAIPLSPGNHKVRIVTNHFDYLTNTLIEDNQETTLKLHILDMERMQNSVNRWRLPLGLSFIGTSIGTALGATLCWLNDRELSDLSGYLDENSIYSGYADYQRLRKNTQNWMLGLTISSAILGAIGFSFVFWDLFDTTTYEINN